MHPLHDSIEVIKHFCKINAVDQDKILCLASQDSWLNNPDQAAIQALHRYGKVDEEGYLEHNPDVKEAGIGAIEHYVRHGWSEKREIYLLGNLYCPQSLCTGTNKFDLDKSKLNIAIRFNGGLGDVLIGANYFYEIFKIICMDNIIVHVFPINNIDICDAIFINAKYVHKIHLKKDIDDNDKSFDLFLNIARYVSIKYQNKNKIYLLAPFLITMISLWERFRIENKRYWLSSPDFDGEILSSVVKGITRFNQPDVYSYLNIKQKFSYELSYKIDVLEYLDSIGLNNIKYITVHRGIDGNHNKDSNKLWPIPYYNNLLEHIKSKYQSIQIVQIGISEERCPLFRNIDVNLVGRTSIEQIKVLLKYAFLHIDCEGGLVHLRHALRGGRSLVLFGPTSPEFYGYSENINLRGKGCPRPCEWMLDNWQEICPAGHKQNICMQSLSPRYVFEIFEKFYREVS